MNERYEPEPRIDPPEDDKCIVPSCGHEIYNGEEVFEWIEGKRVLTICGECLMERVHGLSVQEVADRLQCKHLTVSF